MSSLSWVERDCGAAVKDFCKVETLRVCERRWCPAQGIRRVYLKATLTAAMLKACAETESGTVTAPLDFVTPWIRFYNAK